MILDKLSPPDDLVQAPGRYLCASARKARVAWVLDRRAEGYRVKDIAAALGISRRHCHGIAPIAPTLPNSSAAARLRKLGISAGSIIRELDKLTPAQFRQIEDILVRSRAENLAQFFVQRYLDD